MAEIITYRPCDNNIPISNVAFVLMLSLIHISPAGGSDFWESGVIRPDLVLRDLCTVFNPQAADTAELYYYRCV